MAVKSKAGEINSTAWRKELQNYTEEKVHRRKGEELGPHDGFT